MTVARMVIDLPVDGLAVELLSRELAVLVHLGL
jgi:hypothetical protein